MDKDRVLFWVQVAFVGLFILMIPVAKITGLINSVEFVSYLSLWALVAAHGSWAEATAAKIKVKEEEENNASTHGE